MIASMRGSAYLHCHPVNILEKTSPFLILLVLPVFRAINTLLFSGVNLYAWLQGAWIDITTLLSILGLGLLSWYRYVYYLDSEGIHIKKGIWIVKYRCIPYEKLSVLSIEHPFYLIPFRAVRVYADTDGGLPTVPDFAITIRKGEVPAFLERSRAPFLNFMEIRKVYLPKNFHIAVLSFVASNSLTGVLFAATLISGAGHVLGEQFENHIMQQLTDLANLLAFGVPPLAALLAFVVLGGWALSFLRNLIRHLRFSITRQGGGIDVKSGVFTHREYLIAVRRINLIELRQTLLTKLFGFYAAFIHANGYGKRKDELSVLMPSGEGYELSQNLQLLLPEIPVCRPEIRPKLKYLSRFLIPPITWIAVTSGLWLLGARFLPELGELVFYFGFMAEIPCLWYLFVKLVSFRHTGVGLGENTYTLCYTYGFAIKTIAVPKQRIVKLTIRRSLFQVMSGCCDLVILTFSEGRKRHVVPNLNFEEAKRIMEAQGFYRAPKPSRPSWRARWLGKK